jgi:formamidopyrimidine-DNA glycosylase
MPELPEVETIRRSLTQRVRGARVEAVSVRERRLRRPLSPDFEALLIGRRIGDIDRRGKYLLFRLDDGRTWLVHLGMSGRLALTVRDAPLQPHDHVVVDFDAVQRLVFHDPRRFGLMRIGRESDLDELDNVGPDPLAEPRTPTAWRALVRGRRLPIKNLLMDQRVWAGIGNIYASEMLFRAGIRPRRGASRLRRAELERLAAAMREVLEEAVRLGGSSISDFADADGRPGYFQIHHAVYDRDGQPCPRCGAIIRRVVLSGRSSFYCPRCQL